MDRKQVKKLIIVIIGLFSYLFYVLPVRAFCPVCTLAVGAGLGFSRFLGIDDSVTGVWIGGFIVSSGLWLAEFSRRKKWKIPVPEVSVVFIMALFVTLPLYWSKMIGIGGNTMWGIDKVMLGSVVGAVFFLIGTGVDEWLKAANKNKSYFNYQKVIIPIISLSVVSLVLYLIT